jgi:hypothetical protein
MHRPSPHHTPNSLPPRALPVTPLQWHLGSLAELAENTEDTDETGAQDPHIVTPLGAATGGGRNPFSAGRPFAAYGGADVCAGGGQCKCCPRDGRLPVASPADFGFDTFVSTPQCGPSAGKAITPPPPHTHTHPSHSSAH